MASNPSRPTSPEKPKRRLSLRHATKPDTVDKRPRDHLDHASGPSRRSSSARSKGSDDGDRDAPLYITAGGATSRPSSRTAAASTSTSASYRPYVPSTGISRRSSESGSDETAFHGESTQYQHRRQSRIPDVPPPTSSSGYPLSTHPTRNLSNPRWVTDSHHPTPQTQSSSISSSSSSLLHQTLRPKSEPTDQNPSPPPSITLSTGAPLVGPPLKTQAAFIGKLYTMLEDKEIRRNRYIYWSNAGTTFTCPDPLEFSKEVLPHFFKHNNWQSFVRQLNMYSFNKVNDLYATSSDPLAWEFRHPLFRQGEPQLLASIKRKTTRPSNTEGPSMLSPTDEVGETPRPVAGWMRDDPSLTRPSSDSSPPRSSRRVKPEVFGYNMKTGETITARPYEVTARPASMAYVADLAIARNTKTLPVLQQDDRAGSMRFHPDPDGTPVSAQSSRGHRPIPLSVDHDASAQYPQPALPSPSSFSALTSQIAFLAERVARLNETLSVERVETARTHMNLLSYVANITTWLPNAPSQDVAALQETLDRHSADLKQKYDALVAVDTLAHLAGGGTGQDVSEGPTRLTNRTATPVHPRLYATPHPSTRLPPPPFPDQPIDTHLTPRTSPTISLRSPRTARPTISTFPLPPPPLSGRPTLPPPPSTIPLRAQAYDMPFVRTAHLVRPQSMSSLSQSRPPSSSESVEDSPTNFIGRDEKSWWDRDRDRKDREGGFVPDTADPERVEDTRMEVEDGPKPAGLMNLLN